VTKLLRVHPHVYESGQTGNHYAISGDEFHTDSTLGPNGLTHLGRVGQLTQGTPSAVIGLSSSATGGGAGCCDVAPAAAPLPVPVPVAFEAW